MLEAWLIATWQMICATAAYLFLGLFVAGVVHRYLSTKYVERSLSKPGLASVIKASLFGVPLPLCSCSVIPVGVEMRKLGASRGATAAFFTSTPEIGVDSFILSYSLLGPVLAFARTIAAFISAMSVGVLIDKLIPEDNQKIEEAKSCCCSAEATPMADECNGKSSTNALYDIISYSMGRLLSDISNVLIVGFIISGLISALVPPEQLNFLNTSPLLACVLMLLISMPMYICATSSTPIAAALLAKGLFPGAALAFLLGGPVTNVTTLIALKKVLGLKGLATYVGVIFIVSLAVSYSVGLLYDFGSADGHEAMHIHNSFSLWEQFAAALLIVLLCYHMLKALKRRNS
ncbi:MAG: SO_0444 family Cu/Zn efflux transporter [Deltaproteobacteria bacterium]|nr:SO_0444 family Cu/Zn efflux transporter [Deltaproteobacteria bacterium]